MKVKNNINQIKFRAYYKPTGKMYYNVFRKPRIKDNKLVGFLWMAYDNGKLITLENDSTEIMMCSNQKIKDNKILYDADIYLYQYNLYLVEWDVISGFHWRKIFDDWLGWNVLHKNQRSWLKMTDYDAERSKLIGNKFENPDYLKIDSKEKRDKILEGSD